MPTQLTFEIIIYWAVLALIIAIEHYLFARRWQHYELARRALGVATVMFGALPLVAIGRLDWWTWATLFVAFGVAGMVTAGLYTNRWAQERETKATILKTRISAGGNWDEQTTGTSARHGVESAGGHHRRSSGDY